MAILNILVFISLIAISCILKGCVLSMLWGWFIVPIFGASHLSLVPAMGIALVAGFLTHQIPEEDSPDSKDPIFLRKISTQMVYSLFTLLFGWIIHSFM